MSQPRENEPEPNSEEEAALAFLIPWLKRRVEARPGGDGNSIEPFGFDLYRDLIQEKLNTYSMSPRDAIVIKEKLPLLNAIWDLCIRGILRPGATIFNTGSPESTVPSSSYFALTAYGLRWLQKPNLTEAVPMEYGRFSRLLSRHDTRYGDAYRHRAREAVSCYEAHTYFACCAMCGAAAESILLALAFSKMGEEDALRDYRKPGGRHRVRNALVGSAKMDVQTRFDSYLELLNYWRDESAHGVSRSIREEEAFTSLLLLLRFAQLGDGEWNSLTGNI